MTMLTTARGRLRVGFGRRAHTAPRRGGSVAHDDGGGGGDRRGDGRAEGGGGAEGASQCQQPAAEEHRLNVGEAMSRPLAAWLGGSGSRLGIASSTVFLGMRRWCRHR